MRQLDRLKHVLHRFNKREVGDVIHNYSAARDHYQKTQCNLQQNPHLAKLQLAERTACLNFSHHSRIYESFLRQRSKITWLRFGDQNSAYFHASLKQRKAANRITSFLDDKGQINDKFEVVVAHFLNHFRSIMGSPSLTSFQIQKYCFIHGDTLSLDHQLSLIKLFTKKDVKSVLFSISSVKSPSLDEFCSGFFKVMWKDLGDEIADAILGFFYHGELPAELNKTTLSLIPKVETSTRAVDFRSIACCNC
ncbi:uncharacterized protein LOC133806729 [Humulus lupulus]|uniref:uncharacterized protein LOC133806729 n=1 Tax=Humulus lupulus TaxID=3486 RepID=UPI002B405616|nr:uncharacterized protein LOC133806729 [Humulus lupulus]